MGIFDIFRKTSEPEVRVTTIPHVKKSAPNQAVGRFLRNYTAAIDRVHYGDFSAGYGSADYELSLSLPKVRNKVRGMTRNSGTGKRYIQVLKDNVVGENGFKLQVRVRKQDGTPDRTLNQRVENAWKLFCDKPTSDGVMDIIELEKQMVATWARDGEYIMELVNDPLSPDTFSVNPVEGDILDDSLNTTHPATGNQIRMGVEINKYGRPVAYHFLNQHPGDMSWTLASSMKRYRRVPADRVIHIFERLRPGQTRGEPPASSVPNMVKMLDGYREAEVTGRRIKSSAMGFAIEHPEAQAGAGAGLDGMADRKDEVTENFEMDMEPGTIKKLPMGYDFKQFDPGGAMTDYAQFEGQIKTDVSMGVNISPVALGYETSKLSYSTHRGIIADDREYYKNLQSFFIRMGMMRLFAYWLPRHALNPASSIPPTRMLTIMASSKFMGRGWDQIDPTKDTKAENEQLAARTTSLSRIAAKRGMSRDDLLDEIQDDEQALQERGLTQSFGGDNNAETEDESNKGDSSNDDT